jgi:hypothetical protein
LLWVGWLQGSRESLLLWDNCSWLLRQGLRASRLQGNSSSSSTAEAGGGMAYVNLARRVGWWSNCAVYVAVESHCVHSTSKAVNAVHGAGVHFH